MKYRGKGKNLIVIILLKVGRFSGMRRLFIAFFTFILIVCNMSNVVAKDNLLFKVDRLSKTDLLFQVGGIIGSKYPSGTYIRPHFDNMGNIIIVGLHTFEYLKIASYKKSGEINWSQTLYVPYDNSVGSIGLIQGFDGIFYVYGKRNFPANSVLYAIDQKSGSLLWTKEFNKVITPSLARKTGGIIAFYKREQVKQKSYATLIDSNGNEQERVYFEGYDTEGSSSSESMFHSSLYQNKSLIINSSFMVYNDSLNRATIYDEDLQEQYSINVTGYPHKGFIFEDHSFLQVTGSGRNGNLYSYFANNGDLKWNVHFEAGSSYVVTKEGLYIYIQRKNTLVKYNLDTGMEESKLEIDKGFKNYRIWNVKEENSLLYVVTIDGLSEQEIILIDEKDLHEIARFPLSRPKINNVEIQENYPEITKTISIESLGHNEQYLFNPKDGHLYEYIAISDDGDKLNEDSVIALASYYIPLYDTYGHWAEKDILSLHSMDIISGFDDGNYYPDDPITREQFAVLLAKSLDVPLYDMKNIIIQDVPNSHWSYPYISTLLNLHVINDVKEFSPNKNLLRKDLATWIARAAKIKSLECRNEIYIDIHELSSEEKKAIMDVSNNNLMTGFPDGSFKPNDDVTRAQSARVIKNLIGQNKHDSGLVP